MTDATERNAESAVMDLGHHPPRPRLVSRIGVTGHRSNRINDAEQRLLVDAIDSLLAGLQDELAALYDISGGVFAGMPLLRVVSAVAEGADRLVAEAALARQLELQVVLPPFRATNMPRQPEAVETIGKARQ